MVMTTGSAEQHFSHAIEIADLWIEVDVANTLAQCSAPGFPRMDHINPHSSYMGYQ
jgi:hypothetical protein